MEEPLWKKEGYKNSEHRRRSIKNKRKDLRDYLKRKGICEREDAVLHCIEFAHYMGAKGITLNNFNWVDFLKLIKGFERYFAYFTKEKVGWGEATVPKEKYNDLFK